MLTSETKKIRALKADIQRYELKRKCALQRGEDVTHFDLILDGLQQDIDAILDYDDYCRQDNEEYFNEDACVPQHLIW